MYYFEFELLIYNADIFEKQIYEITGRIGIKIY